MSRVRCGDCTNSRDDRTIEYLDEDEIMTLRGMVFGLSYGSDVVSDCDICLGLYILFDSGCFVLLNMDMHSQLCSCPAKSNITADRDELSFISDIV